MCVHTSLWVTPVQETVPGVWLAIPAGEFLQGFRSPVTLVDACEPGDSEVVGRNGRDRALWPPQLLLGPDLDVATAQAAPQLSGPWAEREALAPSLLSLCRVLLGLPLAVSSGRAGSHLMAHLVTSTQYTAGDNSQYLPAIHSSLP